MSEPTYTCARCHNTYEKGRSDQEAMQDARAAYGSELDGDVAVICEDCYKEGTQAGFLKTEPTDAEEIERLAANMRGAVSQRVHIVDIYLCIDALRDCALRLAEDCKEQSAQTIRFAKENARLKAAVEEKEAYLVAYRAENTRLQAERDSWKDTNKHTNEAWVNERHCCEAKQRENDRLKAEVDFLTKEREAMRRHIERTDRCDRD